VSDQPLSEIEVTALMQISAGAKLDPRHRAALHRLFHLGLIDETAAGMKLTPAGQKRFAVEARKLRPPADNDGRLDPAR